MSRMVHLITGAAALVLGATGAVIFFYAGSGTLMQIFGFAAAVGFVLTAWGLWLVLWRWIRNPPSEAQLSEARFRMATIVAMSAMVTREGPLTEFKIKIMSLSFDRLFGVTLDAEAIRETVNDLTTGEDDIIELLEVVKFEIEPEDRRTVIKACYFVALADGGIFKETIALLDSIARAIGMSVAEFDSTIQESQQTIENELGPIMTPVTDT